MDILLHTSSNITVYILHPVANLMLKTFSDITIHYILHPTVAITLHTSSNILLTPYCCDIIPHTSIDIYTYTYVEYVIYTPHSCGYFAPYL